MGRVKVKPSLDNVGINPFSNKLEIKVNKKIHHVTNKFGNPDRIEFSLESTPFCKLFEVAGAKQKMMALPLRAKELLLYFMYSVNSGMDILWVDRGAYMKSNGIKAVNTFKVAVKVLSDASYIYPHVSMKDVYWINPHYFFKGDRIKKYPNRTR